MLINPVTPEEHGLHMDIAVRTKLFSRAEAESLLGEVLVGLQASALPEGHQAVSCRQSLGESPNGWCYFAPDDHAEQVWNLWWIGVDPVAHGTQVGRTLLAYTEKRVARAGGRLLIIETSDSEATARARQFYVKAGYEECGRIPHFYAENEAKMIFARRLQHST